MYPNLENSHDPQDLHEILAAPSISKCALHRSGVGAHKKGFGLLCSKIKRKCHAVNLLSRNPFRNKTPTPCTTPKGPSTLLSHTLQNPNLHNRVANYWVLWTLGVLLCSDSPRDRRSGRQGLH